MVHASIIVMLCTPVCVTDCSYRCRLLLPAPAGPTRNPVPILSRNRYLLHSSSLLVLVSPAHTSALGPLHTPYIHLRFLLRFAYRSVAGADEFYTQSKSNRCVACGCASHYLRYRVLPACYRKHMPPELKSHRSHDVVLLCIDCHEKAQKVGLHGAAGGGLWVMLHGVAPPRRSASIVTRLPSRSAAWGSSAPATCRFIHSTMRIHAVVVARYCPRPAHGHPEQPTPHIRDPTPSTIQASERMKRQVAVDYGVPLLPPRVPGMATALPLPPALAPPQGQQGAAAAASAAQAAPPQATSGGAATVGGKEANGDCAVDGDEGFRMEGDGDGGGGEQGERDGEAEGEGQEGSSEADAEGGEQLAPALPGGVHPSAARRAGLALQKSGPQMPLERVRCGMRH